MTSTEEGYGNPLPHIGSDVGSFSCHVKDLFKSLAVRFDIRVNHVSNIDQGNSLSIPRICVFIYFYTKTGGFKYLAHSVLEDTGSCHDQPRSSKIQQLLITKIGGTITLTAAALSPGSKTQGRSHHDFDRATQLILQLPCLPR